MKFAVSPSLALALAAGPSHSTLPAVQANDNRAPAGQVRHDTFAVRLIVTMANPAPGTCWLTVTRENPATANTVTQQLVLR